ncbi:site-specific integrase [Rheinheimera sp. UJ63]|uniref:site-specific integrase n=1 Tax=Rheinheimera sp. UJ63 TaxID=2910157 RepID=UPI001F3338E0|nr:site-specific integrase [Rheinheimera sp. UJ63]MCF4010988.1 site-specific integrase [Rheinheimera sp. UJ63]
MGNIRVRASNMLQIDFQYMRERCREQTALPDTPANRKTLTKLLEKIDAEILLGTFVYSNYFPNSKMVARFEKQQQRLLAGNRAQRLPTLEEFANIWLDEMQVSWRESYRKTISILVQNRLIPYFGKMEVDHITKADLIQFRATLGKVRRENGEQISAGYINRHLKVIQMILSEAADRYQFTAPVRLKPLKMQKSDVDPFTLDEVQMFLQHAPEQFKDYYVVRFFTGMRTGEIDGLKWRFVDFDRNIILVRETWVGGRTEYTKNDGSQREIHMSKPVREALQRQYAARTKSEYVFSTRNGTPHNHRNVTQRVWYPTLKQCELRDRVPYQTRHTAATLWLAAGENPEWIARQMGHTTTEMLFRVYSRFVPNLTRQDGSAFDLLLKAHIPGEVA